MPMAIDKVYLTKKTRKKTVESVTNHRGSGLENDHIFVFAIYPAIKDM